jgi:hypothetical protein
MSESVLSKGESSTGSEAKKKKKKQPVHGNYVVRPNASFFRAHRPDQDHDNRSPLRLPLNVNGTKKTSDWR